MEALESEERLSIERHMAEPVPVYTPGSPLKVGDVIDWHEAKMKEDKTHEQAWHEIFDEMVKIRNEVIAGEVVE